MRPSTRPVRRAVNEQRPRPPHVGHAGPRATATVAASSARADVSSYALQAIDGDLDEPARIGIRIGIRQLSKQCAAHSPKEKSISVLAAGGDGRGAYAAPGGVLRRAHTECMLAMVASRSQRLSSAAWAFVQCIRRASSERACG